MSRKKRINADIPIELKQRVDDQAYAERRTITDLLIEALERYLVHAEEKQKNTTARPSR